MTFLKKYIKILGLHAICSIGSLLMVMMFPGLIDFTLGEVLYSFLAIVVFFDLLYTFSWNLANKKMKHIKIQNNHLNPGEEQKKLSYSEGALLGLVHCAVCAAFCALSFAFSKDNSGVSVALYRGWFCEFIVAFKHGESNVHLVSYAVALFTFVPIMLGYIGGAKNNNFIEAFMNKLIYKSNREKKQ